MATLQHLAFVMDGNGRWAELQNLQRRDGHKKGAEKVEAVLDYLLQIGVPYVTLYAFSTENWKRPRWEIDAIMKLFMHFSAEKHIRRFVDAQIKVRFIGRRDRLSQTLCDSMEAMEAATAGGAKMLLHVGIDYGGRDELVRAVNSARKNVFGDITDEDIERHLDTYPAPHPDLVIRTGGHSRMSNFLLWQAAYAEFVPTETLWPDFSTEELQTIIDLYQGVERKFGAIPAAAE